MALGATRTEIIDPVATGEVRVRPTFNACSVCYGASAKIEGLVMQYRKKGDSAWLTESRFPYFADVKNYRGSLFGLAEDTEYEFKIVAGSTVHLKTQTFRTWATDVPIAKTIYLDAKTTFPVSVTNKGSATGWIRFTTAKGFVLENNTGTKDSDYCFNINGAEYVVFDDMIIRGSPARHVFYIEKSSNVRIRNCDISRWGRVGVPRYDFNSEKDGKRYLSKTSKTNINYDPAININTKCNSIVVERCFIHDPRGRSNSWFYSHPAGPEAVMMYKPDHSTVLRYNDFVGSDSHRWNDAVEGSGNFHTDGGFNRDADIYGNYMSYCDDDCIELDGGMQNVRCFDNRFENALCGVSVQGCMVSPTYVLDNLFSGMCDEQALTGQTIKTSDEREYANCATNSVVYVSDNILMKRGSGMSMQKSLIVIATNNYVYDSQRFGDPSKGCDGTIVENNPNLGSSTDYTASGDYPRRPLPFTLSRSLVSGVAIRNGEVSYPQDGILDLGKVVFRYEGVADTNLRQVVCSASSDGAANSPVVYDMRSSLTFANSFSSGPLPFVKVGPGDMIFDGGSSATYTFKDSSTELAVPSSVYKARFSLPTDGTLPTAGYNVFSLLEGRIIFNSGAPTVNYGTHHIDIGGWTAAKGGRENDVSMIVSNCFFTASTETVIGNLHGVKGYNTTDTPALAELVINNGGTYRQGNGKVMYLGAYNSAPDNKTYNTIVRLVVNRGGIFTHSDSYSGTNIRQNKGQVAQLVVDGGTYTERNLNIGNSATANDTTATVNIDVTNGGVMEGEYFTNNISRRASPPAVNVSIRDGGKLLYDSIGNNGYSPNFTIFVDGGTIGTRNISYRIPSPEKGLIGTNIIVKVGAKGMSVETSGSVGGVPLTAYIASPIISGVTGGKDGGVNFVTGEGNTIRVNEDITCSGPVTASGDGTVEFLNGAKLVYDIPEGETSTVSISIPGDYPVVKRGLGHLVISSIDSGFTGSVTVEKGTIGFPNGTTVAHPLGFNGGGVMVPSGETITIAGVVSSTSLSVEGEGNLVLRNQANAIGRLVLDTANVICGALGVCSNAVLEFRGSVLKDGVGYFDLNGRSQFVADIITPVIPKDSGGCQITNSGAPTTLHYSPKDACDCYVKLDGNLHFMYESIFNSNSCKIQLKNRRHSMSGTFTFKRHYLHLDEGTAFPRLTKIYVCNGSKAYLDSREPDLFEDLDAVELDSTEFYLNTDEAVDSMSRCRIRLVGSKVGTSHIHIGDGRELHVRCFKANESDGYFYRPMGVYNLKGTDGAFASDKVRSGDLLVWSGREDGTRPAHSNIVWNSTVSAPVSDAANWTFVGDFPSFRVPAAEAVFSSVGTRAEVTSRTIWGGLRFTADACGFTLVDAGGSLTILDNGITAEAGSAPRTFVIEVPIDNHDEPLKVAIPANVEIVVRSLKFNGKDVDPGTYTRNSPGFSSVISGEGTLTVRRTGAFLYFR